MKFKLFLTGRYCTQKKLYWHRDIFCICSSYIITFTIGVQSKGLWEIGSQGWVDAEVSIQLQRIGKEDTISAVNGYCKDVIAQFVSYLSVNKQTPLMSKAI